MSNGVTYCIGRASVAEILAHLKECNNDFLPPLSGRVEIEGYAHKIAGKTHRFEAWVNGKLAGLVAAYCNASDRSTAFITSVSVLPRWQGRGIATRLIEDCIAHARVLCFARIQLEVSGNNQAAIALYQKHGFTAIGKSPPPLIIMTLDLVNGT